MKRKKKKNKLPTVTTVAFHSIWELLKQCVVSVVDNTYSVFNLDSHLNTQINLDDCKGAHNSFCNGKLYLFFSFPFCFVRLMDPLFVYVVISFSLILFNLCNPKNVFCFRIEKFENCRKMTKTMQPQRRIYMYINNINYKSIY